MIYKSNNYLSQSSKASIVPFHELTELLQCFSILNYTCNPHPAASKKLKNINKTTANRPYVCLPTFHSKVCRKIKKILVVFTIKKVYHIKINYRQ